MAITVLPIDASAGSPAYTAQGFRQALSALVGLPPTGRPLGAVSGVRPGTPASTVFLSGASNFTWNVAAHSGVLDTETPTNAAPYLYATDGTDTGTVTAADATNPRIDIVYIQVNDTVQDGSGSRNGVVGYLAGTPAASPSAPATPARSIVLAQIAVPSVGGGNPSSTWVATTWGASSWTSYTPTTTNVTLGTGGTIQGWYAVSSDRKTVQFRILLTLGTSGALTGSAQFSLPFTANAVMGGSNFPVGNSSLRDSSASATVYGGCRMLASAAGVAPTYNNTATTSTDCTATNPWTWASGDTIWVAGVYEMA